MKALSENIMKKISIVELAPSDELKDIVLMPNLTILHIIKEKSRDRITFYVYDAVEMKKL